MTVTPILVQRRQSVLGAGGPVGTEPPFQRADAGRLFRLARLEADVMSVSLAILAGWQPELFDAVVGEAEAFDATQSVAAAEPEPFRETCGGYAGYPFCRRLSTEGVTGSDEPFSWRKNAAEDLRAQPAQR